MTTTFIRLMINQSRELVIRRDQVLGWSTAPDPHLTEFRPKFELYLATFDFPLIFNGEKSEKFKKQIESSFAAPPERKHRGAVYE